MEGRLQHTNSDTHWTPEPLPVNSHTALHTRTGQHILQVNPNLVTFATIWGRIPASQIRTTTQGHDYRISPSFYPPPLASLLPWRRTLLRG